MLITAVMFSKEQEADRKPSLTFPADPLSYQEQCLLYTPLICILFLQSP